MTRLRLLSGAFAAFALSAGVAEALPSRPELLTADSFRGVHVGQPIAEVQRRLGRSWVLMDALEGGADGCRIMSFEGGESDIEYVAERRQLSRILIVPNEGMTPPSVRTDRGVGIGASLAALRRAYGAALIAGAATIEGTTYRFATVWTHAPRAADDRDRRGLQFILENGRVSAIYAGRVSAERMTGDC